MSNYRFNFSITRFPTLIYLKMTHIIPQQLRLVCWTWVRFNRGLGQVGPLFFFGLVGGVRSIS